MNEPVPTGAVVVGVDGSHHSLRALDAALDAAAAERRPLHLVHCYEQYPAALGPTMLAGEVVAELRAQAEAVIRTAREHAAATRPEVRVTAATSTVDAREKLSALSERASLVVVGSRGLGGLRSLLLGSVSLWVSHHTSCPVLVVRPTSGTPGTPGAGVLVGADGTARSVPAVEHAFATASVQRLPLTVVHCLPPVPYRGPDTVPLSEELDDLPLHRLELAETVAGLGEKYPDVQADLKVVRGPAATHLVTASEHSRLVVVGSHQGGLAGLLGGWTSRAVVEHAHCPVVVVPDHVRRA